MNHRYYKVATTYYDLLQNNARQQQWRIQNKTKTEYLVCVCSHVQSSIEPQYEITKEQFDMYLFSSDWK